jgi:hypothetical protein
MKVKIDTSQLNITWSKDTAYRIEIDANAVTDDNDNSGNLAITNAASFNSNPTGPEIYLTEPVRGGTNVSKEYEIEIQMNRLLQAGLGNVELYESVADPDPDILVKSYTPSEVDIHDDKIYLDTFGYIEPEKTYYVLLDDGFVKDSDEFNIDPISSPAIFTFSTALAANFPSLDDTYIANTSDEGSYTVNDTSTLIGNTPTVVIANNDQIALTVEAISNAPSVNNYVADGIYFDYVEHSNYSLAANQFGTYSAFGPAISGDGLTMAVANSSTDINETVVIVYTRPTLQDDFTVLQTITPPNGTEYFGRKISISKNGEALGILSDASLWFYRLVNGSYVLNKQVPDTVDTQYQEFYSSPESTFSEDGTYYALAVNQSTGSSWNGGGYIQIWKWNGTTYNLSRTVGKENAPDYIVYRQLALSPDGTKLIARFNESSDWEQFDTFPNYTLSPYAIIFERTNEDWTTVLLQSLNSYINYNTIGISNTFAQFENKVYKYENGSYSLHQTLPSSLIQTRLVADGSKILTNDKIYDYVSSSDTFAVRNEFVNVRANDWINDITQDGTISVTADSSYSEYATVTVYNYENTAGFTSTDPLTFTGSEAQINEILNNLALDVSDNLDAYDGEIRLKYTFDTTVTSGADVGVYYRYQRIYST